MIAISRKLIFKISLMVMFFTAHIPTLLWLVQKSGQGTDSMLVVSGMAIGLIATLMITVSDPETYPSQVALGLLLFSLAASIINLHVIQFPQFSVAFLLIGSYALAGLSRHVWPLWSRMLSLALLLSLALPFYLEFSSGLGFGVRLYTASMVETLLHTMGFGALSSHDVIMIENAILHIDIPCSGLKSIWLGHLFFLLFLMVFRVRISWKIAVPYVLFLVLLVSANVTRVLILTILISIYKVPDVAEVIHAPLGIMGFGLACIVAGGILAHPWFQDSSGTQTRLLPSSYHTACFVFLFILATAAMGTLFYSPAEKTVRPNIALSPPEELKPVFLSLTAGEKTYFSNGKQTKAQKWKIKYSNYAGSMMIVRSQDFNRFHAPEICMAAHGITVDRMKTIKITPHLTVRLLSLENGRMTGIYWLQTGTETTDSFTERYWRYIWGREKNWSMVSMIINVPFLSDQQIIKNITSVLYKRLSEI